MSEIKSADAALPELPDVEKLRAAVQALASSSCESAMLNAAQRIAEPEHGGKALNVYMALPQIAEDVRAGNKARIDINKNETVQVFELTAAMVAAALVAKQKNIKLEDVPLDDIIALSPGICEQLQREKAASCKPERKR
jgi:hypothetical protein